MITDVLLRVAVAELGRARRERDRTREAHRKASNRGDLTATLTADSSRANDAYELAIDNVLRAGAGEPLTTEAHE